MSTTDFLVDLGQVILFAAPIGVFGAWVLTRGVEVGGGLVGAWRSDPWPMGVQEEDPDHVWGLREPAAISPAVQKPADHELEGEIEDLPDGPLGPDSNPDSHRRALARVRSSVRRVH